ncbi:hypothetical protein MKW94_024496 [Papaver nudicaule]|uniref:Uncharacterized protein n=1 Tax=Papaver nudicaule TaxID=74823 RepID=A0AA41RX98_PAPNU|nr:hypothetical protein [Papaver nudicaule]
MIDQIKSNIEEERRMLRISEVLREERVQMKLSKARVMFEEKLLELEYLKIEKIRENFNGGDKLVQNVACCEKSNLNLKRNYNDRVIVGSNHRKSSSSETENPHIKRGIKGFVEFPRVVKAISLRGKQLMVSKLDPQKTRLHLLLRQKSLFSRANNLFMG